MVFTIYGHGGHLGHVTLIIYTIYFFFISHFPWRLHMEFGFGGQAVSEKMFKNNVHNRTCLKPQGLGQTNPWDQNVS